MKKEIPLRGMERENIYTAEAQRCNRQDTVCSRRKNKNEKLHSRRETQF